MIEGINFVEISGAADYSNEQRWREPNATFFVYFTLSKNFSLTNFCSWLRLLIHSLLHSCVV